MFKFEHIKKNLSKGKFLTDYKGLLLRGDIKKRDGGTDNYWILIEIAGPRNCPHLHPSR